MKLRIVPRRVTWDDTDRLVGILARMGLHTLAIAKRTGLSPGQVCYRLYQGEFAGARRSYRDGDAPEFDWALDAIKTRSDREVYSHVKKQMQKARKQ